MADCALEDLSGLIWNKQSASIQGRKFPINSNIYEGYCLVRMGVQI